MAIQPTYTENLRPGVEGFIVNTEPKTLISRTVEDAAVGFGKAVSQGAADNGVVAASAATDVFRGITVVDRGVDPENADQFAVGDSARVMTKGVIWVVAGEAVAAGDDAYMKVGTADAGKLVKTATSNLPIPNAIFDSSGAKDALVKLRLA